MQTASLAIRGSATRTFPFLVGGRSLADPAEGLFFLADQPLRPVDPAIERATTWVRKFWQPFHFNRARDIWYRKARRVEDYEVHAIISAAEAKEHKELRHEFAEIQNRIRVIQARLDAQDAEFHGPSIAGFGEMARQVGGKDRA